MSVARTSHDLRVRFGIILGLALLPLLMFSVWQSYHDYQREIDIETTLLRNVADDAVREVVETLSTIRSVLSIASETMDPENCTPDINRILTSFPRIYNVVMSTPDGTVLCTGRLIRSPKSIQEATARVSEEQPYYIDLPNIAQSDVGPENVIVITYGKYEDGKLQNIVLAGFDVSLLNRLKDISELPKDTELSILSPSGSLLLGSMPPPEALRQKWLSQTAEDKQFTTEYVDNENHTREINIFNAEGSNLFIAISTPKKNLLSSNKIRPFQSAIIPVLAWLFGFLAIWLSTDRLILVHLRKMRAAIIEFAGGNSDLRIGHLKEAPDTIDELARAFDGMADTVDRRETELRESLDEKETLLREIHHRVKNNLQIIISLLNIQERKLTDPEGLTAIRESRNRINAIALVHKALYESDDITVINMNNFINQIMVQMRRALLMDRKKVKVSVNVDCSPMDSDRAIPIALYIVEAVTNASKHGVVNGGIVEVNIATLSDNLIISICDNGKLLKEKTAKADDLSGAGKESNTKGMGGKLMSGFARQLSGTHFSEPTEEGYKSELTIPAFVEKSSASHI